ncbi:MAG: outer membrane lipoprotein carrier protein LolA [Phycisphaeraceae bacterium]
MKPTLFAVTLSLLMTACASAQTPTPGTPTTPASTSPAGGGASGGGTSGGADPAITLLDRLEARGAKLKTYQAHVTYTREQPLLGDQQIRTGNLAYQSSQTDPTPTPARFAVRFTKLVVNEALRDHPRNYIFDGTWLAEVDPENKQFIRRQVVAPPKPGQSDSAAPGSYDPLQLGQGPFPLPLGQKREQVLAIFHAVLVDSAADDPADTLHLKLTPRTDGKTGKPLSNFTTVNIWYDTTTLLPVKIITEDDSQNMTTVKLADAKVDQLTAEQAAELFDTAPPATGGGWKVEIKPYAEEGVGGGRASRSVTP